MQQMNNWRFTLNFACLNFPPVEERRKVCNDCCCCCNKPGFQLIPGFQDLFCRGEQRGNKTMFFFGMCFVSINEIIPLLTDYPRQLLQEKKITPKHKKIPQKSLNLNISFIQTFKELYCTGHWSVSVCPPLPRCLWRPRELHLRSQPRVQCSG